METDFTTPNYAKLSLQSGFLKIRDKKTKKVTPKAGIKGSRTFGVNFFFKASYSPGSIAPVGHTPAHVPQSRQRLGSML